MTEADGATARCECGPGRFREYPMTPYTMIA